MLKKYLIASASGLAMLVMVADTAKADPISASIVAAIGLTGFTATVATVAITAAISMGLSYAANALFAPSMQNQPGGAQMEVQAGGALPRQIPFGVTASAGHLTYWNSYGKKNRFLQRVYTLADWECDALVAVWVDGNRRTLTSVSIPGSNNEAARFHLDGYGDKFVVRWFSGTTTQLADTELVTHANPTGRWTTSHRGRGVCYVSLTLTYDDDLFQGGFPQLLFEFRGAKLYDIRKDSTSGGVGAHRWNDPATWEFSENPGVCAYNYLRGFYRGGTRILGWGLPDLALDIADLVSAMNLSDEAVVEGGSSVARYRVAALVSEGNELRQGLAAFTEAMGGFFYEAGGVVHVKGGGSEASVKVLTAQDVVNPSSYSYKSKPSRSELVNRVSGVFTDPANSWQAVDYPEITSASWLADDNGEDLSLDYPLPSVTWGYQAERIARIRANMARLQKRLSIEVLEKHIDVSAGKVIEYSDAKVGTGVHWLVAGHQELPEKGTIRLTLQEYSAAAFEGASLFTENVYSPPDIDAGITTVQSFTATGTKIDDGGGEIPALLCQWTPPDDSTVTGVKLEYSVNAGGAPVQRAQMAEPEEGQYYITDGIAQNTEYNVRATIITTPVRGTTWTDTETATTPIIAAASGTTVATFAANGTWLKSAYPVSNPLTAFVQIEVWGGGGGGCRRSDSGGQRTGGGGGAYAVKRIPYNDCPAEFDVEVGLGGAGGPVGGGQSQGQGGGTSVVKDASDDSIVARAFGGGSGNAGTSTSIRGGGGGGLLGAGQPGNGGSPNGGGGLLGGASSPVSGISNPELDGGGGHGGSNSQNGGNANLGGAGGGSSLSAGGVSVAGGRGGNGQPGGPSTFAQNGSIPGGGGGCGLENKGGDGGRGEVQITVFG